MEEKCQPGIWGSSFTVSSLPPLLCISEGLFLSLLSQDLLISQRLWIAVGRKVSRKQGGGLFLRLLFLPGKLCQDSSFPPANSSNPIFSLVSQTQRCSFPCFPCSQSSSTLPPLVFFNFPFRHKVLCEFPVLNA